MREKARKSKEIPHRLMANKENSTLKVTWAHDWLHSHKPYEIKLSKYCFFIRFEKDIALFSMIDSYLDLVWIFAVINVSCPTKIYGHKPMFKRKVSCATYQFSLFIFFALCVEVFPGFSIALALQLRCTDSTCLRHTTFSSPSVTSFKMMGL